MAPPRATAWPDSIYHDSDVLSLDVHGQFILCRICAEHYAAHGGKKPKRVRMNARYRTRAWETHKRRTRAHNPGGLLSPSTAASETVESDAEETKRVDRRRSISSTASLSTGATLRSQARRPQIEQAEIFNYPTHTRVSDSDQGYERESRALREQGWHAAPADLQDRQHDISLSAARSHPREYASRTSIADSDCLNRRPRGQHEVNRVTSDLARGYGTGLNCFPS